nr:unnamed protein product [Callosobruchus analis]
MKELLYYYDDCYQPKPFSPFVLLYETIGVHEDYDRNHPITQEDRGAVDILARQYPDVAADVLNDSEVESWKLCAAKTFKTIEANDDALYAYAQKKAMRCIKLIWLDYVDHRVEATVDDFVGCYKTCPDSNKANS